MTTNPAPPRDRIESAAVKLGRIAGATFIGDPTDDHAADLAELAADLSVWPATAGAAYACRRAANAATLYLDSRNLDLADAASRRVHPNATAALDALVAYLIAT